MANTILSVRDLRVNFSLRGKTLTAVRGASRELYENETLAIVGESGSGKSVLTKTLIGMTDKNGTIVGGSIDFKGTRLDCLAEKDWLAIRGKRIAMVFQDPMTSLDPAMAIGKQIMEGMLWHFKMPKAEAYQKALKLLEEVGITDAEKRMKSYPHQLSGGMRQRVVIAIALSCDPDLLISDEPTTALDVTIEAQILRLMKELRDETGMSVLIITHNMGVVAEICDYVYVMYAGKIMEQAEAFALFDHTMHPYT